ncbi:MAG TPA: BTAD domain-containing putative transcriptional regulator [Jiangellaceae bacterium]
MGNPQVIVIGVLGALEVRRDGTPLIIPGAKPREILTLLGLNAGRVVPADVIQDVLWGDEPPRTAHKALQTHISALRRALGVAALVTEGPGWRLGTGTTTDAAAFESAVSAARRAVDGGRPAAAIDPYELGVELWRGAPQLPPTPRGTGEAARWVELYEAVLDERTDALLASGHNSDLIGELEAAVTRMAARPFLERSLRVLESRGRNGDDDLAAAARAHAAAAAIEDHAS